MWRFVRRLIALVAIAASVGAAAYVGLRMGRRFERNQLCCDVPRERNISLSLREALGLVEFPSQIGQDRWVSQTVFPDVGDGFFLDVGSADGFVDSNTWALERRGWTGICVDPFPTNVEGRKCQVAREVVGSVAGVKVTFLPAGNIGGVADHLGRWKGEAASAKPVELTTVTLDEILRRANAPAFIHYLSLDIEGAELDALRGFPFDRHRIGAMTIEHNYEEPKRSAVEQLLRERGYERVRTWQQDDFYLPVKRE
jgi:FkbM family methyltransferase